MTQKDIKYKNIHKLYMVTCIINLTNILEALFITHLPPYYVIRKINALARVANVQQIN